MTNLKRLRDEMAKKRGERCWPTSHIRQLETRCDFIEGFDCATEHILKRAEEILVRPILNDLKPAIKCREAIKQWLEEFPSE